jgi:TPR repeat protein
VTTPRYVIANLYLVAALCLLLAACFPYTSVPMVALTGYDLSQKRDKWRAYAAKGDVYAMYELGESYSSRPMEGGTDHREAFDWYCKAAKNGYGKAQMRVGHIYLGTQPLSGIEMKVDLAKAHMWFSLARRRALSESFAELAALEPQMDASEKKSAERMIANYRKVPCGTEDKNVQAGEVEPELKPETKSKAKKSQ